MGLVMNADQFRNTEKLLMEDRRGAIWQKSDWHFLSLKESIE